MNLPLTARRSRSHSVATSPRGETRGWKIGPRIRIGGTLGKVGQAVKIGTGKVLSNKLVDSGLALIPGVGPGIAAAANVAGNVLDTSNGGIHSAGDVGKVALNAGEAYLGGKAANVARDAVMSGGVGSAASKIGGAIMDKAKGAFSDVAGAAGVGGAAGGAGSGGGGSLLQKGLLLALVGDQAERSKRQTELQNTGLDYAKDAYAAKQPLREQGLAQMQAPATPNLSAIFNNSANPFAAQKTQPVAVAPKVPVLPTSGTY